MAAGERVAAVDGAPLMRATGHVVVGFLRCPACGYALRGQPVLHLEDYDLHAVRCPECGRLTPGGEALLLGAWAGRLTWLAFLGWTIAAAGLWMAFNGLLYAFCRTAAVIGAERYRMFLDDAFRQSLDPTSAQRVIGLRSGMPVSIFAGNFTAWWGKQDPAALFAAAGGWRGALDWSALLAWIPMGLVALLLGMTAAVAFDRLSRRGLLLRLPIAVAPLIAFLAAAWTGWEDMAIRWASEAAYQQMGLPILLASAAFASLLVAAGFLVGRPVTRRLLRATAPRLAAGVIARLEPTS